MIVYKDQGINWQPQSDSLGVSSLKWTCSTPPLVSGLRYLVESLGQIDFALLVVSTTMTLPWSLYHVYLLDVWPKRRGVILSFV